MIGLMMLVAAGQPLLTGNELQMYCANAAAEEQLTCLSYILGVSDGVEAREMFGGRRLVCLPEGTERQQLVDVGKNWLRDHPADRQAPAGALITIALVKAFPCPK